MENEKTPLYVAFSTQKGGVGKTTFTVLAASYLYYLKGVWRGGRGLRYPQHSTPGCANGMLKWWAKMKITSVWRMNNLPGWERKPIPCYAVPPKSDSTADEYITAAANVPDIVF